MAEITVGVGKDYATITAAVDFASLGDTIYVFPGVYDEQIYIYNKYLNIVGVTDNPESQEVLVRYSQNPLYIRHTGVDAALCEGHSVVVENLYLNNTESNYAAYMQDSVNATSSGIDIYINKCVLDNSVAGYGIGIYNGAYDLYKNLYVTNCRINWKSGVAANLSYIEFSSLLKCIVGYDNITFSAGSPSEKDFCPTDQLHYGPRYGEFIVGPPNLYSVDGVVTDNGTPVVRKIKLFYKEDNKFLDETYSDISTGEYYFTTTYSGEHFVICEDAAALPNYNDLIRAKIIPKIIS